MAYYTKITKNNLQKHIAKYNIGKLYKYVGITDGIENTNYFLKTQKGKFVLTIYENKITERIKNKHLPFFINLINFYKLNKIPCPSILSSRNNKKIINFYNKPSIIFEFVDGKTLNKTNKNNCYKVGKILGLMHKTSIKFNKKKKNDFSFKEWEKIIKKKFNLKTKEKQFLKEEIKFIKNNWPKSLPSGVIHGDLFPDNVFFKKKKINGIIDLSNACTDFFSYDLSICINSWCFEKKLNMEKVKYLISGYNSERKMKKEEIYFLNFFLRASSLRFYLSRLMDSKNNKIPKIYKKNPNDFLKKLKYFQSNDLKDYFLKLYG